MKSTNYHTIGRVSKLNSKFVERGNINTLKAQMNDLSLSLLGTGRSILYTYWLAIPEYTVYKYFIMPKNIRLIVEWSPQNDKDQ